MKQSRDIQTLIDIMVALRDKKTGCPWDIEQTIETIIPYTIEEVYEVADAIEREDHVDLCDELGDLLLQVVYFAQIANEQNSFSFGDVVEAITKKMIRRHPHVFGNQDIRDIAQVNANWQKIKAEEKQERREKREKLGLKDDTPKGYLANVKTALAPAKQAIALQESAAKVGFDWTTAEPIFDKLLEEVSELKQAIKTEKTQDIEEEFGDLYFVLLNLARRLNIDPEKALKQTNTKFRTRFAFIEDSLEQQNISLEKASLEQMEDYWQKAKSINKTNE